VRRALHADDGGHLAVTGPPLGAVSTAALLPLVDSVRQSFDTPPRDARVIPAGDGLRKVPGRAGATVRSGPLGRAIVGELASTRSDGAVEVRTTRTEPDVTEDQLAARDRNFITVDRAGFKLRYFHNLKLAKTYPIAVGQVGLETPAGLYDIQDKQVNPSWTVPNSAWAGDLAGTVVPPGPGDPLKARWMGFSGGAGIHGTDELDSLGTAASHGCIRMSIPDVIDLYDRVDVGTPVFVS
jgi:lipoprotein-anchoring transpeptidase ErfK/SrfK